MRKSKLIFIMSFLVIGLMAFKSDIRADNEGWPWAIGGYLMSQPPDQYTLGFWYGDHSPYWHGYHGYPHHYYFHYPYQERSPYANLEIKQAGELLIMVNPSQAEVYVDGYLLKPDENLSYRIGLLIGKHQVEVRAEGYKPYFQETGITTGQRTSLSVKLEEGGK